MYYISSRKLSPGSDFRGFNSERKGIMLYFIVYKEDNRIMFKGTLKECKHYYQIYENRPEFYEIMTRQQIRQLEWDF